MNGDLQLESLARALGRATNRRDLFRIALTFAAGALVGRKGAASAAVDCPPPLVDCFGICADLGTDPLNCGYCGNTCASDEWCCGQTLTSPGICANLYIDINHCGACFNACPSGWSCLNGFCVECPSPLTLCDGMCVDTFSDTYNCNVCGHQCVTAVPAPHQLSVGRCHAGYCYPVCEPGYSECGDPVCADLANDPLNCGNCLNACAAGESCQNGACVVNEPAPCFSPTIPKGIFCGIDCVDPQSDPLHCGACFHDCFALGLEFPACCDGACVGLNSSANCGGCGIVCGENQMCVDQQCSFPSGPAKPTAEPTPTSTIDKWKLWSGDSTLAGASLYLRRLTADDDPDAMGLLAVGPTYSQADFTRLATLGANYVDLSHPAIFNEAPPYSLDEPLRKHLDLLVGYAKKADLFAIISVRTGPARSEAAPRSFPVCQAGGCFSGGPFEPTSLPKPSALWSNDDAQQAWIDLWKSTARRFHNNPIVIGYHLLAMPDPPDSDAYRSFLQRLITAIRSVDPLTPILVSAPGSGLPSDLVGFEPLAGDRIVYRCDAFEPARYLRQLPDASSPLTYGGDFDPARDGHSGRFDRAWIAAALTPAVTWAADHRRPVLLGGYGMPRWQPGLEAYLDDLLDLFDLRGLHAGLWAWHPATGPIADDAFNLEHGPDPAVRAISDNPLLDVLKQHWRATDVRPSTTAVVMQTGIETIHARQWASQAHRSV